jgi:hypothetical protein
MEYETLLYRALSGRHGRSIPHRAIARIPVNTTRPKAPCRLPRQSQRTSFETSDQKHR